MMSTERRVVDVADPSYGSRSPQPPPPPTAKRKIHSEDDPLPAPTNQPKRAKKAAGSRSAGRKLTIVPVLQAGDEPGPSTRPTQSLAIPVDSSRQTSRARSPKEPHPRSPSSQPVPYRATSVQLQPPTTLSTTSRKPHSTSYITSTAPPSSSAKGKARQASVPPTPSSVARSATTHDVFGSTNVPGFGSSRLHVDSSLPLPLRETPLIERNREMRSQATARRRNSLEHRRRASESLGRNGDINTSESITSVVPHPNVSSSQFHRHISVDVPPVQRTRQLLVWSSSRTQSAGTRPGTPTNSQESSTPPAHLPTLSVDANESLRSAQEAIVRTLADGTVDTTPFSEKGKDKAPDKTKKKMRPNPMNEKNKKRIEEWKTYIARADAEQKIWLQIKTSANSQLSKLAQTHEAHSPLRNAKKPPEEWFPLLLDAVDERWRDAAQLARSTSALDATEIIDTATQELLKGVELHVDELEDMVNTTYEMTHRAESLLHKFFTTVSSQLSSRATYGTAAANGGASTSALRQPSGMSLIELLSAPRDTAGANVAKNQEARVDNTMAALRALSRVKLTSAATVSSVASSTSIAAVNSAAVAAAAKEVTVERRMTAVPPRTPGKDRERIRAKTPRKGSTPGRTVKR